MAHQRKWFHQTITGQEAEAKLKTEGSPGTFLVRPSKSSPGDFTLSVRRGSEVTHIKIQNSGDFYDLYGGEKFATLSELVDYYRAGGGELKEKDGNIIQLLNPLLSEDPTTERWFHGGISGSDSERLLKESGDIGSFLVRASNSKPGDFVASVRTSEARVTHVMIRNRGGRFDVGGGEQFEDLTGLVEYYKENPMVETSGNVVQMTIPLNGTKVSAASIVGRVEELSRETDPVYGKAGFWEEFEALQAMEAKHIFPRTEGQRPENKTKNRYKNILPFDKSRVVLKDVPRETGADYVNASYIKGEAVGAGNDYIACQGCLKATVGAFWQMMWENNSRVIVMTTAVVERGKNKCAPYWPTPEGPMTHDKYTIAPVSAHEELDFILREMTLHKTGEREPPRRILQYHFKSWPDHGVPREPGAVLQFLITVNRELDQQRKALRGKLGQMVVHCSAGIGRTGTFIIVDMLLRLIAQNGPEAEIDIQKTVQDVRAQRSGMIQTEGQYKFLYEAIAQHIENMKAAQKSTAGDWDVYGNIPDIAGRGGGKGR